MAAKKKPNKKLSPTEQREAKKQAKQKKILFILGPVLLIAVGLQLPKLLGGSEEPTVAEATATDTAESGSPTPEGGGEAPPATDPNDPLAGAPAVAAPITVRLAEVTNSDPLAAVDSAELISFSTFVGEDPFVQLVESKPEVDETKGDDKGTGSSATTDPTADPGDPAVFDGLAILEVNGDQEVVASGATFPADDPAFKLVDIKGVASIEFGLAEGSFSSGIDTLDLDVGKSITLVSQPDGFRYTIRLVQIALDAGVIETTAPAEPPAE